MSDDDLDPDELDPDELVVVPIEDEIDLHTFSPRDVRSVVEEYLLAAREAGFLEVRIVHGKGKGVQRSIVRSLLEGHPDVVRYDDAPPGRGHYGATLAVLRPLASD